jgi:hypothetical protein
LGLQAAEAGVAKDLLQHGLGQGKQVGGWLGVRHEGQGGQQVGWAATSSLAKAQLDDGREAP